MARSFGQRIADAARRRFRPSKDDADEQAEKLRRENEAREARAKALEVRKEELRRKSELKSRVAAAKRSPTADRIKSTAKSTVKTVVSSIGKRAATVEGEPLKRGSRKKSSSTKRKTKTRKSDGRRQGVITSARRSPAQTEKSRSKKARDSLSYTSSSSPLLDIRGKSGSDDLLKLRR